MFKRPRASNSRSSLSSGAGELYQMWLWPWTKAFKRARVSSAKGCSRPLRAPWSHQTSLGDASAANAWSIASTWRCPDACAQ